MKYGRVVLLIAVVLSLSLMVGVAGTNAAPTTNVTAATNVTPATNATPGAYVGDDGGASWSCGPTEAGYGKMIYGYGNEGLKWYLCKQKGWTFDIIVYLS